MPRCATQGRGLLCFRTTACFKVLLLRFYCVSGCSGKDWLAVDHDDEMEAAWLYVQYLFGIPRDDCDYDKILLQLTAELKAYIKLLVCFPDRILEKEFAHISEAVCASDLVRVSCIAFSS